MELGLFWWNFENVDAITTGIYSNFKDAVMAIKMHKEKPKKQLLKYESK